MVDSNLPLDHELLKISKAESESEIPPDAHDDNLGLKMASLKIPGRLRRIHRKPIRPPRPRLQHYPVRATRGGEPSLGPVFMSNRGSQNVPFARVADLLKEVLPVGASTNHETVREHLQRTAERIEEELGEQRQPNLFEGREDVEQPLPNGPMTWHDGGYVRAAHKEGCFEVIAGRSVVAFRRAEGEEVPPAKCFGFVQTFDKKPRRRLWELMKSQGMQEISRWSSCPMEARMVGVCRSTFIPTASIGLTGSTSLCG